MIKSTILRTSRALFTGVMLSSLVLPMAPIAVAKDILSVRTSRSAPFSIFDPSKKRDQFQHLLFLAEHGKTEAERGKAYRYLGGILDRVGRHREALRAYEAGALQGDQFSAKLVLDAFVAKRYKPSDLPQLIDIAVLPAAESGGVSAALLLADLIRSGRLKGTQYHTSSYWLQLAAENGSRTALRLLAEAAERRGNVKSAISYYAALDGKRMSRLDRALRQAKLFYLGEKVKRSTELAFAWLNYAATRDAEAAGKLAARLYRQSNNAENRETLLAIAKAGGVPNPDSGGGLGARLAAAKSAEERTGIMAEIKGRVDAGDADATVIYWRALIDDGAPPEATTPYLSLAVVGGSTSAIGETQRVLARSAASDPLTASLLGALEESAAGGNIEALKALGALYAAGGPVIADQAVSLEHYRKAADAGDRDAQLRVGLHFAQEEGDPASIELARRYLRAAADQGSASAKAYLEALPAA